jgi:hypothetical protein
MTAQLTVAPDAVAYYDRPALLGSTAARTNSSRLPCVIRETPSRRTTITSDPVEPASITCFQHCSYIATPPNNIRLIATHIRIHPQLNQIANYIALAL